MRAHGGRSSARRPLIGARAASASLALALAPAQRGAGGGQLVAALVRAAPTNLPPGGRAA